MSTTYYWKSDVCLTCGHQEELEIGSHGAGWVFTLRSYHEKQLTSWREWKLFLLQQGGTIKAHCGNIRTVSHSEFIDIVESRENKGLMSVADEHPGNYTQDQDGFTIERHE